MVQAIRKMDNLRRVILEGEIIAIDPGTSQLLPFQELMHRRRKYGVEEAMQNYPVIVNVFDVIFNDSKTVTSSPYEERRLLLRQLFLIGYADLRVDGSISKNSSNLEGIRVTKGRKNSKNLVTARELISTENPQQKKNVAKVLTEKSGTKVHREKTLSSNYKLSLDNNELKGNAQHSSKDISSNKIQLITQFMSGDKKVIQRFMDSAIEAGCEGIMLKNPKSAYRAGSREYLWIKVKREYRSELTDTLDLVIVGALHGRGRRVGKYGALLLAAYDEKEDLFRSVSKVGTGFTDQHLESFYNSLESLRIGHRAPRVDTRMEQMDVWFEPKIVIEVVASEITLSPAHTAGLNSIREGYGLALRFPKFTGKIRDDKSPEDATTVQELTKIFRQQLKSQTKKM